ncbi:unnamed protein product [Didymodactylos carnosus]|nr:unnamed protein product [Didymodactylos carnosus]CAF4089735.1 unnamed protein product [Didymodactylos carnosus]
MSNRSRGGGDGDGRRATPPNVDVMHSLKVDNLTYRTRVEDLRRAFEKFGEIGDIYIPRDQFSRSSRGYAFIRFAQKRDAEDALDRMDSADLDGREIRVQFARYGRGKGHKFNDASTSDSREKVRRKRSRSPRPRSRSRDNGRDSRSPRRSSRDRSRSPRRNSSRNDHYSSRDRYSRDRSNSKGRQRDKNDDKDRKRDRHDDHNYCVNMTTTVEKQRKCREDSEAVEGFTKRYYETFDRRRHDINRLYHQTAKLVWNGNAVDGQEAIRMWLIGLPPTVHCVYALDYFSMKDLFPDEDTTYQVFINGTVAYGTSENASNKEKHMFSHVFVLTVDKTTSTWVIINECFRFNE